MKRTRLLGLWMPALALATALVIPATAADRVVLCEEFTNTG